MSQYIATVHLLFEYDGHNIYSTSRDITGHNIYSTNMNGNNISSKQRSGPNIYS